MSGVLDFLFDGQQPTSTTTYGSSVTNVPTWLSDYTQGLIAKGNQIAGADYPLYSGPRVASLTPDQQAAFDKTRSGVGQYDPMVQQAGALTQTGAAGVTPDQIKQFENPYTDDVIKKAEMDANNNYNENILPTLSNTFTASGQYGSSRMAEVANNAARDLTSTLQTNSNAQRAAGFNTAAGIAQNNAASALQGGQNLGALATTGQNIGLKDAAALESIGTTQQNQNQNNLNTAYQDFQSQTNYDKDNLSWLSNIIRGIATPSSTTSQQTTTGTANGSSGLSQVTGALDALSGLAGLFTGKKEGGAIRLAEGGSVYDSPISADRGEKRYINTMTPATIGALTTTDQRPQATLASPEMTADWYNTYGTGPEHLFYSAPPTSAQVTGYATPSTAANGGDVGTTSTGGKLGLGDIVSGLSSAKSAYNTGSKLYDKLTGGSPSGLADAVNKSTQVDDLNNLDNISNPTPTLDVADAASELAGEGSGAFGTGFSSIAPNVGAELGLSPGAASAANQAADLGAGFSSAPTTTVGDMFGTSASQAGLSSPSGGALSAGAGAASGSQGAIGSLATTHGSSVGTGLASSTGSSSTTPAAGALGTAMSYIPVVAAAYQIINGMAGDIGGSHSVSINPVNSNQKIIPIPGTSNSALQQGNLAFGGGSDSSKGSGILYAVDPTTGGLKQIASAQQTMALIDSLNAANSAPETGRILNRYDLAGQFSNKTKAQLTTQLKNLFDKFGGESNFGTSFENFIPQLDSLRKGVSGTPFGGW